MLNSLSHSFLQTLSAETVIRELFDRANVGMSLAEIATRRFVRVNDKLCEMLGYTAAELTSKTAVDLTYPDDREADRQSFERFVRGELKRRVIEKRYLRKDGSWVWVRITTTVVQLGTFRCSFGITEDITERRDAEAEVERAERRKDRFLALLAHELRNPLASIRNCAELMRTAAHDDAAVARARDVIERQSRNLGRLVDDLLDASRISTGKVTLRKREVAVREIVPEAIDLAEPLVRELEHELHVVMPPGEVWVFGDKLRLVQALGNLLTNAAKYTQRQGFIRVEARQEGAHVHISVTDNGPGIAPEALPHVFSLFQQSDGARPGEGLGIGLTVTRQLIEMHGGEVTVRSRVGAGSTFEIRLAAASAPAEQPTQAARGTDESAPAEVLVVEDNVDAAETLQLLLSTRGHHVRVVADGASALRAIEEHAPGIVLMDIGLPDIDGHELARRFRDNPKTREALMIAISGYGQRSDIEKSIASGFNHHLVKPVDYATLERLLTAGGPAPA